jgi:hypothetical protein
VILAIAMFVYGAAVPAVDYDQRPSGLGTPAALLAGNQDWLQGLATELLDWWVGSGR